MKTFVMGLILVTSSTQASFMVCENDSFKVDVLSESGSFVEDEGMQGAQFDGEVVVLDKRSNTSFKYTSVFQTYNEFNDFGVFAMAFSADYDLYQAVAFEFASEGDTTATVSIQIPAKGFEGYNGYSGFDEEMYKTRQEMGCEIQY